MRHSPDLNLTPLAAFLRFFCQAQRGSYRNFPLGVRWVRHKNVSHPNHSMSATIMSTCYASTESVSELNDTNMGFKIKVQLHVCKLQRRIASKLSGISQQNLFTCCTKNTHFVTWTMMKHRSRYLAIRSKYFAKSYASFQSLLQLVGITSQ